MKILVTGSTGLVGTALVGALTQEGHTICRLVRRESSRGSVANTMDIEWNPAASDPQAAPFGNDQGRAEGAEAVVNLAGASIAGGRWTEERKALLRSSRVDTTRELVTALGKLRTRPRTLVSASAIGYYGSRGDQLLTEESRPGEDFLAHLSQEWEGEAVKAEALGMRVVRARFGIILAKHGGALPQMMKLFQFGLGGKLGTGQQWMSWVTVADVVAILKYALENKGVRGAVNVVSPQPVRNAEFSKVLGEIMHRPAFFAAPAFALRLA